MSKRSFSLIAALGLLASLGGSGSANASSITQTFSTASDMMTLPFMFTVHPNSFDTALGTLNSVVITVSTSLTGDVTIYNFNTIPPATSSYSNVADTTTVTLTGPNGLSAIYTATTAPVSGTVPNATVPPGFTATTLSGLTGTSVATTTITGSGLSFYEKPPAMNTVTLTYMAGASMVNGTLPNNKVAITGSAVGGATLTITYNYLAVPEPASMGLLGIGMAGFFAFRRLFNKRSADV